MQEKKMEMGTVGNMYMRSIEVEGWLMVLDVLTFHPIPDD
jgi:hypothetical protein